MESTLNSAQSVEGSAVPSNNAGDSSRTLDRLSGAYVPTSQKVYEWHNRTDPCGCVYGEMRINGHRVQRAYKNRCDLHIKVSYCEHIITDMTLAFACGYTPNGHFRNGQGIRNVMCQTCFISVQKMRGKWG